MMQNFNEILVSGADGFVGRRLVAELLKDRKNFVYALDKRNSLELRKWEKLDNFKFICVDIKDEDSFKSVPKDIDTVFHLASVIPKDKTVTASDIIDTNIASTFSFLNHIKTHCSAKRIVYSSSISVYSLKEKSRLKEETVPGPDTVYGASKLMGEYLVKTIFENTPYFILRYSSIYGSGQNQKTVLPLFLDKARKNEDIFLYEKGERKQNFVYITDVIKSLMVCLESNNPGVYNIGNAESTSMLELAKETVNIVGSKSQIRFADKREEEGSVDLDISKAERLLGFKNSFSLKDGLREIYQSIK